MKVEPDSEQPEQTEEAVKDTTALENPGENETNQQTGMEPEKLEKNEYEIEAFEAFKKIGPIKDDDKKHFCIICGYYDDKKYCSSCGAELEFLSDETSGLRGAWLLAKEFFREFANPPMAFIKTLWLILIHPVLFFSAVTIRDCPVHKLTFPLAKWWRFLGGKDHYQNTLDPIKFYLTCLAAFLVSGSIMRGEWIQSLFLDLFPNLNDTLYLISGVGFGLLLPIFFILVFNFVTGEKPLKSNTYLFWTYILGVFLLIQFAQLLTFIPFIPMNAVKGIMTAYKDQIGTEITFSGYSRPIFQFLAFTKIFASPFFIATGRLLIAVSFSLFVMDTYPNIYQLVFTGSRTKGAIFIGIFFLFFAIYPTLPSGGIYTCTSIIVFIACAALIFGKMFANHSITRQPLVGSKPDLPNDSPGEQKRKSPSFSILGQNSGFGFWRSPIDFYGFYLFIGLLTSLTYAFWIYGYAIIKTFLPQTFYMSLDSNLLFAILFLALCVILALAITLLVDGTYFYFFNHIDEKQQRTVNLA